MLRTIKENNNTYILLNNTIKIDIDQAYIITSLKNAKPEHFIFNTEDKLWYYKNYKNTKKLIDIFYSDDKIKEISFKNDNINDYRYDNLVIVSKINNIFKDPIGVEVLLRGDFITITEGKYAKQSRNMYWKVKDNNKIYFMIHLKDELYTKISEDNISKVLEYKKLLD